LCACSGCADGVFLYHVNGVLVSAPSGEPIADANIIVNCWRPDPNEISCRVCFFRTETENDGAFSGTAGTGLAWGCIIPFCWAPAPPKLPNIFIGVQLPDRQWYIHQVNVTADMQKKKAPAERWIELGTIAIPVAQLIEKCTASL